MYEPWALNIDLSIINFNVSDPDHPNVEKLTKISTKQARTGIVMSRGWGNPKGFCQGFERVGVGV